MHLEEKAPTRAAFLLADSRAPPQSHLFGRDDEVFAAKLEAQLERYKVPKGLGLKRRHLGIFRDIQDILGNELSDAIQKAIEKSKYLIVLCSHHSRESMWVGKEIEAFVECHGKEYVIPVLIGGRPNSEVLVDDNIQDQAFHETLYKYLTEPLAADFRSFTTDKIHNRRKRHKEAKFQLLALLLQTEKEILLNRQQEHSFNLLLLSLVITIMLSTAFAWIAYEAMQNSEEAERQRDIADERRIHALARQLTAEARQEALSSSTRKNQELSGLLIAESLSRYQTTQGFIAWQQAMYSLPQLLLRLKIGEGITAIAKSSKGDLIAVGTKDGRLGVLDNVVFDYVFQYSHDGKIQSIAFSPDNRWMAVGVGEREHGRVIIYRNEIESTNSWKKATILQSPGRVVTLRFEPIPKTESSVDNNTLFWLIAGMATSSESGKKKINGALTIWGSRNWEKLADLPHKYPVLSFDLSPDGRWLATGSGKYEKGFISVFTHAEHASLRWTH